jgi:hypothetical protein
MPTPGGIRLLRDLGQTHFQLIGQYEPGKVAAISELVRTALSEGDRVVLFGREADYVR